MALIPPELDTIIIRGLPKGIALQAVSELMRYFGIEQVKDGGAFGIRNAWLAKFPTSQDAEYALRRLHQLSVFGKRLCVEFAGFSYPSDAPNNTKPQKESRNSVEKQQNELLHQVHAISAPLGIKYPISSSLKYLYPPPSPSIIANIANALIAVPKFYTQVLHLMNKMNLPSPFGPLTPSPPMFAPVTTILAPQEAPEVEMEELLKEDTETEESELESDEDSRLKPKDIVPDIPIITPPPKKKRRPINKLSAISSTKARPAIAVKEKRIALDQVFETEKEPKTTKPTLQIRLQPNATTEVANTGTAEVVSGEGFGKFVPPTPPGEERPASEDGKGQGDENDEYISRKQLQQNKAREEDMRLLPAFRNYSPGEPTARLYIKNLAKEVEEKDLRYIYGRYVIWTSSDESNMFDVRLLTGGRMKGQAFVTLPSISRAEQALQETNGYVLNGKPMVVHYARSAKPK